MDIVARIHQGRYDTEKQLLTLKANAERTKNARALDAIHQRLKKVFPNIYQRLVGPLRVRNRDKRFNCYCNKPKPLHEICNDILNNRVPRDALSCDNCWDEDLTPTWGYYGWTAKKISVATWEALCTSRSFEKFVE